MWGHSRACWWPGLSQRGGGQRWCHRPGPLKDSGFCQPQAQAHSPAFTPVFPPLLLLVFPSLLFANSAEASLVPCLDLGRLRILGNPDAPFLPNLRAPLKHTAAQVHGGAVIFSSVCVRVRGGRKLPGGGRP